MIVKEPQIPLFDLVTCLSDATDLISPMIVNHHKQVAYIAYCIGFEMGLPVEELNDLVLAGAVHDIGALSLEERIDALHFELETPHQHAQVSAALLKLFEPFPNIAPLVEFHHVPWNNGEGIEFNGKEVPSGSHILHLADRIVVLINKQQEVLGQVERIRRKIAACSGKIFSPHLVEVFDGLAKKESFWLDVVSPSIGNILGRRIKNQTILLRLDGILSLSELFRRIIDFRCCFTAAHSSGVAASAAVLARLAGFSDRECRMMKVAGNLHDLGKLAIPLEILQKPGRLNACEFRVIKSHAYYTYRILESINDFEIINSWAAFHHEGLDGSGYPFHFKGEDIPFGSRIVAVADVFTALMEDRPYRKGMKSSEVFEIIQRLGDTSVLDTNIISLLKHNYDEVNASRIDAQKESVEEYKSFSAQLNITLG